MNLELNPLELDLDQRMLPYAMRHASHGGRLHGQEPHPARTCYQRDRDRLLHSKAFRRLGYKTQVFINSAGDNYRTRLTHSLEVAQISRSVCQSLGLNPDFAEALALAHDLGHTPFGHAGQESLNLLMRDFGGFEHNRQSLRIVSYMESRYLEFAGLNLTRSTLAGMMKHAQVYDCDTTLLEICQKRQNEQPCLEAALVDQCDRIAYIHHDLEDGLDSRILQLDELAELEFWQTAWHKQADIYKERFTQARKALKIRSVIRRLMDQCIQDLLSQCQINLQNLQLASLAQLQSLPDEQWPVRFTPAMQERTRKLQHFLYHRLYRNPEVMRMSRRGSRIIETLFREFQQFPELMPVHYQDRIEIFGRPRVVADYISGMTDRFAYLEYSRLTGHRML